MDIKIFLYFAIFVIVYTLMFMAFCVSVLMIKQNGVLLPGKQPSEKDDLVDINNMSEDEISQMFAQRSGGTAFDITMPKTMNPDERRFDENKGYGNEEV